MASKVFKSKRHDTAISPTATFTPPQDLPFDLLTPAGSSVMAIVRLPSAPAVKFKKPAVITGPWTIQYNPDPSDVADIGAFDMEFEVTLPNGKKFTLPTEGFLQWVIQPDLDNQ